MNPKIARKVAPGEPLFPDRPRPTRFESDKRAGENQAFAERCRAIFWRVAPELRENYPDWYMIIEPDSGEYFLDPDEMTALRKAKEKYPTPRLYAMRLNETGACGRI
ncbi:hypothetical protein V0288_20165 [Pannus brasiliensis CCIBt3594]|uniref:Uncharacterized protein n=1 Tax=Pannus brasiliensis CCIBt3594 TaxID=1427578 RepID=A0AAW9QQW7_9CHRO